MSAFLYVEAALIIANINVELRIGKASVCMEAGVQTSIVWRAKVRREVNWRTV